MAGLVTCQECAFLFLFFLIVALGVEGATRAQRVGLQAPAASLSSSDGRVAKLAALRPRALWCLCKGVGGRALCAKSEGGRVGGRAVTEVKGSGVSSG